MLPLCRECSMNTTHYFLRSIFNISPGERSDASRGCKLLSVPCHGSVSCKRHWWSHNATTQGTDYK
ncbi:unnamed protein product, partial [Vitis vinifera]|uniref:Uncharacterized protein n=1 Tax=Vitis vinifera TaxID=29760 RepID=D7SWT9_VITVI